MRKKGKPEEGKRNGDPAGRQKRSPALSKRLLPQERDLVNLIVAKGYSVAKAERALGITETWGYKILKRPRVAAYMEKLGGRVEETAIQKVADKIVDMLGLADERVIEALSSPRDNFFGYKDILAAAALAYKRKGGFAAAPKDSPGAAIAAAQVNVNINNQQGERVYESRWIRNQEGIVDPECDAIDEQLRLGQHAPPGVLTRGTEAAADEVEAEDGPPGGGSEQSS